MEKMFMRVSEVMEALDVSESYAYKLIRKLNKELEKEGTEKVDNTACIWYNVYIKYRRCFYDRTTAEIGVKSIHGNI